jgi:membrane-associated HD superfamily phosphohydrolase
MQDKSSYSNNSKPQISEILQNFINAMVEEIVLKGEAFDEQKKKWLKKYSENEGLNYVELEGNLNDFFSLLPDYLSTELPSLKKAFKKKSNDCFISDDVLKKILKTKSKEIQLEKQEILKTNSAEDELICPYCGKTGNSKPTMYRWHFDNCKDKGKQQSKNTRDRSEVKTNFNNTKSKPKNLKKKESATKKHTATRSKKNKVVQIDYNDNNYPLETEDKVQIGCLALIVITGIIYMIAESFLQGLGFIIGWIIIAFLVRPWRWFS